MLTLVLRSLQISTRLSSHPNSLWNTHGYLPTSTFRKHKQVQEFRDPPADQESVSVRAHGNRPPRSQSSGRNVPRPDGRTDGRRDGPTPAARAPRRASPGLAAGGHRPPRAGPPGAPTSGPARAYVLGGERGDAADEAAQPRGEGRPGGRRPARARRLQEQPGQRRQRLLHDVAHRRRRPRPGRRPASCPARPAARPASVGTSCLFEEEIFIGAPRGQAQCSSRQRPRGGARGRGERRSHRLRARFDSGPGRKGPVSAAAPGSRVWWASPVAARTRPSYTSSSSASLSGSQPRAAEAASRGATAHSLQHAGSMRVPGGAE